MAPTPAEAPVMSAVFAFDIMGLWELGDRHIDGDRHY
jgi:hypothetical protein